MVRLFYLQLQGADKTAKAPGGETVVQIAQSEEIKELLQ